jgi:hypothetical protein
VDHQVRDRRQEARFAPPAASTSRATLRPGHVVSLVDVSGLGALVEAVRPMRPGARVHLQVTTPARNFAIAAQVVWCTVWTLDPIDGVTYRGALKFEQRIDWVWGEQTRDGYSANESCRPEARSAGQPLPDARATATVAFRRAAK